MIALLRALGRVVAVTICAVTIAFLTLHVVPGDPARVIVGAQAGAEALATARRAHGLDDPLLVQYGRMLAGLTRGELGTSLRTQRPVAEIIADRVAPTALLVGTAVVLHVLGGISLGVLAAMRRGRRLDRLISAAALLGQATPTFVVATFLMYWLGFRLGWLPFIGAGETFAESLVHVILPALSLGVGGASVLAMLTRSEVLRFADSDFARTARAKGLSEIRVVAWHALRPAAPSLIAVIGAELGTLLTGAVVVEAIFGWPGLGRETVRAVFDLDVPLVIGIVVFVSIAVTALNAITDLAQEWLTP